MLVTITRPQNGKMSGINEGKRHHKQRNVNFIQDDPEIVNSFSRSLIGYFKKSLRFHWLQSL